MKIASFIIAVFSALYFAVGCSSDETELQAQKELQRRGLKYSPYYFIEQVKNGNVELVKLYLKAGMSPDQSAGWRPVSALTHAASAGQTEVAKILLQAGADVNYKDDHHGITPLEAAAFHGHADVGILLIREGANINAVGKLYEGGAGPILEAAVCGPDNSRLRQYLFQKNKIDKLEYGSEKNYPKYRAIRRMFEPERLKLVMALLSAGAKVDIRDKRTGNTPLLSAAGCGYTTIARALYNAGANINAMNKYGSTALSIAAGLGHVDFVEFLIASGADINKGKPLISAVSGDFGLYSANMNDRVALVKLLLESDADISLKNIENQTAYDIAKLKGYKKIVNVIESYQTNDK